MKFTCEKYLLQAAVNTASRAAAGKSPLPALEGLLIEASHDVRVTGYDLKKGIYTGFQADVPEPGAVVLGARLLGEIVRSLPDGMVTISSEESGLTSIVCGKSDFSIMGSQAEEYPELPSVDYENAVSIQQKLIKSMIGDTSFAISDNESRPVYTGALFEIENNLLTIVAVDGYRLALRREEISGSDQDTASFIVPGSALTELEKICGDTEDMVKITLGSKHISFTVDGTVLISRRLEGEFLNYKKSIPTDFNIHLSADRSELLQAVDRVSLIIDDKVKNPLRFIVGDGEIKLLCATALGKAEDVCSVEGDGGDLEIGFNNLYLRDALRAAPAKNLTIGLNTGTSPCVVMPKDGERESYLYMILPVRLKAGD